MGRDLMKTMRKQSACITVLVVVVVLIGLCTIADGVFTGFLINRGAHVEETFNRHRFCIDARGFKEFGQGTNDPNGLAFGHITIDEETRKMSWKIKYSLSEQCPLTAWHLHGPIEAGQTTAPVLRQLPSLPFGPTQQGEASGTLQGHIVLTKQELWSLIQHPESFYANFHSAANGQNSCYPNGAVRDATAKICPNPLIDLALDLDDEDDYVDTESVKSESSEESEKPYDHASKNGAENLLDDDDDLTSDDSTDLTDIFDDDDDDSGTSSLFISAAIIFVAFGSGLIF